jgi:hypothetical protein
LGESFGQASGASRREIAKTVSAVIASEAKQSMSQHKERMDCFASLAMTWRGRGVLDAPRAWGMTVLRAASGSLPVSDGAK